MPKWEKNVGDVYLKFEAKRKSVDAVKADQEEMDELNAVEKKVSNRSKQ